MNFVKKNQSEGLFITPGMLRLCKLDNAEWFRLHVCDGVAVILNRAMTAKDIFDSVAGMYHLSDMLMEKVIKVCGLCNCCGGCGGPNIDDFEKISIPEHLLLNADIPADAKLCAEADPDEGTITIMESDAVNLLSDIPEDLIPYLLECGICTACLETLMAEGQVLYGSN